VTDVPTELLAQGSTAWLAARCGLVTASRVADVIAKTKSGWGASRANYMAELIAERLTGQPAERFTNAAMQWGTDTEPQARAAYEFFHDVTVEQVGLVIHPTITNSAASPDGLVGDDGLVELKCPQTATHIDTLLAGKIPAKYITQIQWQMACTGRQWCDFVSFDPRLPGDLSMFCRRVQRDDERIGELGSDILEFLADLGQKLAQLQALQGQEAA
jgi:putative phage-type endonuclease